MRRGSTPSPAPSARRAALAGPNARGWPSTARRAAGRSAAIRDLGARLVAFSLDLRDGTRGLERADLAGASLHLRINLVTSTILQIVNEPPGDVSQRALLDEPVRRVELWIRPD